MRASEGKTVAAADVKPRSKQMAQPSITAALASSTFYDSESKWWMETTVTLLGQGYDAYSNCGK